MAAQMLSAALELCKKDENAPDANQRFRLGIFQYNNQYKD